MLELGLLDLNWLTKGSRKDAVAVCMPALSGSSKEELQRRRVREMTFTDWRQNKNRRPHSEPSLAWTSVETELALNSLEVIPSLSVSCWHYRNAPPCPGDTHTQKKTFKILRSPRKSSRVLTRRSYSGLFLFSLIWFLYAYLCPSERRKGCELE